MGFEGILNQIFQPYFYYSVIFLVVSFVCVKILTRYCSFIGQRTKSLLYIFPLVLPLTVMLVAFPSTGIQTSYQHIKTISVAGSAGMPFCPFLPTQVLVTSTTTVLSVTGVMCYIGLIAGALFALSMVLADDRLARKVLHVILLAPEEHHWLQAKVTEGAKKLGVGAPKIGVVEDLRPNAFTIGYGKRASIVFSVGLLNILSKDEVAAVAFHELAHVKNNDFFFKTISNALTTVSFFNPLAYISSSTAQRERELLADERAVELLEKPTALGNALAKICKAIQNLPKESMLVNFSSNLLITSSVLHRVGILSTHPRLDTRLRNISAPKPKCKHWSSRNTQIALVLSLLLICSAVAVSLAMVDLQVNFTANFTASQLRAFPSDFRVTGYQVGPNGNGTLFPGLVAPPFDGTQTMHVLIWCPNPAATARYSYANTGYNPTLNVHVISVAGFVVVSPQNSSYAPMQVSVNQPGMAWFG